MPHASPIRNGTSPHTTPVHPQAGDAITIVLPADFTAFCQLHHRIYRRYARLLITDARAADCAVERALGDLAACWRQTLASHRPTAMAWAVLTSRIHRTLRTRPRTAAGTLYRLLPTAQADAVLLHHVIGLSTTKTAETTGTEPAAIATLLHAFDRHLQQPPTTALPACWNDLTSRYGTCETRT
ncbi:hypothetical protein [Streptomyces sp. 8N706]|uniref:hypothetical protein n=1 Tax=Streptomyces sp. 8N706 TaxID=3457416 RepID=UPI003FD516AE